MKAVNKITLWHLVGVVIGFFLHDKIVQFLKGKQSQSPTK